MDSEDQNSKWLILRSNLRLNRKCSSYNICGVVLLENWVLVKRKQKYQRVIYAMQAHGSFFLLCIYVYAGVGRYVHVSTGACSSQRGPISPGSGVPASCLMKVLRTKQLYSAKTRVLNY